MDDAKSKYRNETMTVLREIESTYYDEYEAKEIKRFIRNYSHKYFSRIKFEWNGKSGEGFLDENYKFREKAAIYYILNCNDDDNIELCKDIFIEEARCSKESWGANEFLYILGEKMLSVEKDKYILQFLEGALSSFDTYGCCLSIRLDESIVLHLIKSIHQYLNILNDNEIKTKEFLEDGKEYIKNFLA